MNQRRKSFNTVNSGPNKNRVQIPDCQHHHLDNMTNRLRERRSTRFSELSTSKDTSKTSNVKTVTTTSKQPNTKSRFREAQHSLDAIKKNLQKAWKNKEFTKEDMEKAEADWKFEAMCSGEAYYEYGKWKWRY
ncbi:hypothetical protein L3Y34_011406 [Caenorhabditis briggsae]|uniref:Uncharacterized protein n=1 Tax=Caenorhabditis briggsae TaxID=6238 RepID=A0AAE8ZPT9_CAEBR|nr:hypothetical protein L3Y34_011406 [Caenorhabditis briggsae]